MKKKRMDSISLCMVVKNEEAYLPHCLKSVRSVVDEIVVVDTGSTDGTIKIARQFGAHIVPYRWRDLTDLNKARNVSLRIAKNDTVLVLDADESIGEKDVPKLKALMQRNNAPGFRLEQRNYTDSFGLLQDWKKSVGEYPAEEEHSGCAGWISARLVRLFRKRTGVLFENGRHATVERLLERHGTIIESDIAIHHFQCLKGEGTMRKKQLECLYNDMKHARRYLKTANYYYSIACVLFTYKDDYAKAIANLKKAVKADPSFIKAYPLLAMAYRDQGKPDKAIDVLITALKQGRRSADVYVVLAISYADRNMYKESTKALSEALAINPLHPLAHNILGVICANRGYHKEAIGEYLRAVQIHPSHPEAYFNLGLAYHSIGKRALAIGAYKKARAIDPNDREASENLRVLIKR